MVNPASRTETPDSFELIDDASVQSEIDAHSQHATPEIPKFNRAPLALLYLNVLVIATCGLVYELLAGTLASYVLGDSVTQFSLIIGVYLSALGVGAWLSSFVKDNLARCFIEVELGVAVLGGLSAPILFLSFSKLSWFTVVLPVRIGFSSDVPHSPTSAFRMPNTSDVLIRPSLGTKNSGNSNEATNAPI